MNREAHTCTCTHTPGSKRLARGRRKKEVERGREKRQDTHIYIILESVCESQHYLQLIFTNTMKKGKKPP